MLSPYHGRSTATFKRLRKQVLKESTICWLCGQPDADTVDHVVPLSIAPHLGEVLDNLRAAHMRCNSARGNKLAEQVRQLPHSRQW